RLAAVVAGADRDPLVVEELRHVVRVDALDVEHDDPGPPIRRGAVERDAGNVGKRLESVGREPMLVRLDRLEPDRIEVVDRRSEADGLGDWRGPGLELRRKLAPRRLLVADV